MQNNACIVAYCTCGCEKLMFAAVLPDAETHEPTARRISELHAAGHRIENRDSEFVRRNWNEHSEYLPGQEPEEENIQLTLF